MRLAGIILDVYDDPNGRILRENIAESGPLPEKLASARLLDAEQLETLPDRLFALVADNHGETVRKYAMHDAPHLATSLIYFQRCNGLLPEELRSKVAANLVNACAWYDLDPPDDVVKLAILTPLMGAASIYSGGSQALGAIKGHGAKSASTLDQFRAAQASGTKVAAGRQIQLNASEEAAMQRGDGPESGHIFGPLAEFSKHDAAHKKLDSQIKQSNLVGTEVMPQAIHRGHNSKPTPAHTATCTKTAWLHGGDVTGVEPEVKTAAAEYENYALPHVHKYPIDTAEQVKTAERYFDDNVTALAYSDRRAYAQNVAERAAELGVKVAGRVMDYAGDGYGPFVEAELHSRIQGFLGTGHDAVYETLLESLDQTPPMVMAEMLKTADAATGAAASYGRPGVGYRDPYAAVYGGAKLAAAQPPKEDTYSWRGDTDYVSGFMLKAFADRQPNLDATFGKGFSKSFISDPIGIFESMPEPQKVLLSRLASDNISGTFRI